MKSDYEMTAFVGFLDARSDTHRFRCSISQVLTDGAHKPRRRTIDVRKMFILISTEQHCILLSITLLVEESLSM